MPTASLLVSDIPAGDADTFAAVSDRTLLIVHIVTVGPAVPKIWNPPREPGVQYAQLYAVPLSRLPRGVLMVRSVHVTERWLAADEIERGQWVAATVV